MLLQLYLNVVTFVTIKRFKYFVTFVIKETYICN